MIDSMSSRRFCHRADMTKVKFPRRRSDGSFCVEVVMSLSSANTSDLGSAIQDWWSNEWMPKNKEWTRIWNRGHKTERTEVLRYDDEFSAPPQLVRCEGSQLRFRLLGRSSTKKFWKDWMVLRIVRDLTARFPAVGRVIGAQNCD
jgi:hypothetical protein